MTNYQTVDRDWSKPLWGAIGLYVVSIVIWVITSFVLIMMDLKDPVRIVATLWGLTYPITLVIGLIGAILARYAQQWRTYIHALLLPLYATVLAVLIAIAAVVNVQLVDNWWRTNYQRNPPTLISELKIGTAFEQATEDPAFANTFILPEGVTPADIRAWDGEKLIFQTSSRRDRVEEFYARTYEMIGFDLTGRYYGWTGGSYRRLTYDLSEQAHFTVLVSAEEGQAFTRVAIVTCQDEDDCYDFEKAWSKELP